MRTTLSLDDALLRAAKVRAAREGQTLTRLIEEALARYLAPTSKGRRKAFRPKLLKKMGRALAGERIADRNWLYERMEGRA